jgi:hypothetical protein
MKILISKLSDGVGHLILDAWHAYQQHLLDVSHNYRLGIEYEITDVVVKFTKHDYNLTILLLYFESAPDHNLSHEVFEQYDLILICNGGEPLMVCNPLIKDFIQQKPNVYLIANSYLQSEHCMVNKTIWFPHNVQTCRDYWTRHYYPQYFENQNFSKLARKNTLYFINGANRAHRHFFIELCQQKQLKIPIQNSMGSKIIEIGDSQWESQHDQAFREDLSMRYETVWPQMGDYTYYDNNVWVGIQQRFGSIPMGYFLLPLYFENFCVVFPESGWQNNELNITEKALKCFYAGSLPFPIGGANVNKLYNNVGFYTAWNLLPTHLQLFDSELDHEVRYCAIVECLKWIEQNPQIFHSDKFREMTAANKINFLTCHCDQESIKNFDGLIKKHVRI